MITFLIAVGLLVAGIIDFYRNRKIGRTLPRLLVAFASYPLLVALSLLGVDTLDENFRTLTGALDFDLQAKIFLIFFLLAYSFCGVGLIAFVAQKLPFLRQTFNPVEEKITSVFTSK